MTEHKNIYMALAAAQSEFGQVTKGSTNPAFKSKYADLSDVANVVIPVMNRHGCAVLHYMVDGAMRTEFAHGATDTKVSCDVPLIVEKNNMQGMKSATTYAKRIGLESLSGIAPEDDDGNAAAKAAPAKPAREEPRRPANKPDEKPATRMITPEQIDMIKGLMPNQKTLTPQGIIEALGLSDFNELTFKQASGTIRRLQEECRKANPQHDEELADSLPY